MPIDEQASSQLYEDVFEQAPFGLYTLDAKGFITSFNPKMADLAGDDPREVIGLNVFEMDSYQRAGLDTFFADGIAGKPFETEVEYVSFLGKKHSIRHYRGVPINGGEERGQTRLLLIVEDVTERRQTEAKLEHSRQEERLEHERLRLLINSMSDAVIATNREGVVVVYNGAALELLNTNETLNGKLLGSYLHATSENKQPLDLLDYARREGKIIKRDDVLLDLGNDDFMNLYVSISPIHVSYGVQAEEGFMFLLRDITKEKSLEVMRDEFVSVISHELRTPIAVAEANVSTAMLPTFANDPAKITGMLEQAHQSIRFLGSLVADLTTLAKAERGLLDFGLSQVDPQEVVQQVLSDNQKTAEAQGLELRSHFEEGIKSILSSRYHVQEIVQNLVSNALKYTQKGYVEVSVRPSSKNPGGIQFAVRDTGIGISAHDKKQIFGKFFRAEDYRTRTTSGTGLGLYISKKLAERLGGDLSFESVLDQGSTFYFDIPPLDEQGNPVRN